MHPASLPKNIDGEQNHLPLNWVLITREWLHHVIRNRIYQQKAGKEKRTRLTVANRQPQPNKTEYCGNEKCDVASNPQIVSADDVELWPPDPKISRAVETIKQTCSRMFTDKLPHILLILSHETEHAQLLKCPH